MKIIKLTDNPSPKGFGYDAHLQKNGKIMIGKDGKLWIVKKYNNLQKWVISDFYKEYKKSENILIKLMKKSIINFTYKSYENIIKEDKKYFDNDNDNEIHIPENNIIINANSDTFFLASYEFRRLCCLSGYYKYVVNTGENIMVNDKKIKEISYFFQINKDAKIWKNFDKECKKYKKDSYNFIEKNKMLIDNLDKKKQLYIYKFYTFD